MDLDDNNSENTYIKLVSADSMEFFVDRQVAINGSVTIKTMLEGGRFRESEDNIIRLPEIDGTVLEEVIKYLHYKQHHLKSTGKIPEFKIEPEIALELLVAANYLQC